MEFLLLVDCKRRVFISGLRCHSNRCHCKRGGIYIHSVIKEALTRSLSLSRSRILAFRDCSSPEDEPICAPMDPSADLGFCTHSSRSIRSFRSARSLRSPTRSLWDCCFLGGDGLCCCCCWCPPPPLPRRPRRSRWSVRPPSCFWVDIQLCCEISRQQFLHLNSKLQTVLLQDSLLSDTLFVMTVTINGVPL